MDWKEYKVNPGEGMFEKIERRMHLRRAWRIGGIAAIATVGVVVAMLALPDQEPAVAVAEPVATVQPTVTAEAVQPDATVTAVMQKDAVAPVTTSDNTGETAKPVAASPVEPVAVAVQQPVAVVTLPAEQEAPAAVAAALETTVAYNSSESNLQPQTSDLKPQTSDLQPPTSDLQPPTSPKADPPQPEPYHEDDVIWAPNIIIPNGDEETIRDFRIKATSELSNFHIYIYNRGGRQLFSSTDPHFVWNATVGGTPVPQGAYVWVIYYRDTNGVPCQRTGTVTVVR